MKKYILVIDDDLSLVKELRRDWLSPDVLLKGPPDLELDLPHIRDAVPTAAGIVLDLNIGGSDTYGTAILRKISRDLKRRNIPVIIWSKYLGETIVAKGQKVLRLNNEGEVEDVFDEWEDARLPGVQDWVRIQAIRKVYPGTRGFVSKTVTLPVRLLNSVLQRTGLIELGPLRLGESP
jgi:hypothetical protein